MTGVIIPAYKRPDCLRKALTSLTLQNYTSFYVVVVDDHSPEPLKEVVDEFKKKLHIKYIYTEKNGGPGVARQIGLEWCYEKKFEYVMFMDSDDLVFPHTIAMLNNAIHINDADFVSSSIWKENVFGLGEIVEYGNIVFLHGKYYKTSFLKENNISFSTLRTNEDLVFNFTVRELSKKPYFLDETLYFFRAEPNSITRNGKNSAQLELDYGEALYLSYLNFSQKKDTPSNRFISSVFNAYNSFQRVLLLNEKIPKDRFLHFQWLLQQEFFKESLHDPYWIKQMPTLIQQGEIIDGVFLPFKQTFSEWLEEMIDEDSCD